MGGKMNKHVRICVECDHHRISETGMHLCSVNDREFDLVTGEFVEKIVTCREMRMPGASCGISGELFDAKG